LFQGGTYTCTATNDLGSTRASVLLDVQHVPSCRLRKETMGVAATPTSPARSLIPADADPGPEEQHLVLRCDVEANPSSPVTYSWFLNDRALLTGVSDPVLQYTMAASDATEITFACQATNSAGTGEACSVRVGGAAVAPMPGSGQSTSGGGGHDDHAYLAFGVLAVFIVLVALVAAAVVCRRLSVGKYALVTGKPSPASGVRRNNGEVNHMVIVQQEQDVFLPVVVSTPTQSGTVQRHIRTDRGLSERNGAGSHAADRTSVFDRTKVRTLIRAKSPACPEDATETPLVRGRAADVLVRTCGMKNVRAPKELWLV
jgi:hypothetical protein